MRVKICGITNNEDAQAAVELGADALGFVFTKSSRQVTKEQARGIIENLPPFVSPVGVFVDERVDTIKETCDFCSICTVQLHGNEDPLYLQDLRRYKIIKAFRIREEDDLKPLVNYKPHAFLLDSYVKGAMGGTGVAFNWEIASQAHKYGAIILSGGLTPENVKEAIRIVNPYAVDVSSGVESALGKKDKALMKRFIMNAKFRED
ncbi:MAG: phosphoribosylanthranilate isomerase [Candidatus Brocadia sp. AMX2]|uniref:N-(5'-phosphoribosyl)anthranilate isomerase n=2 Tax=Candidatus Brocadiaceae TaxID=1127830 RepID=A0ABQ0K345_9BACT|nr:MULTISPECIES: phosphoribosylanthranilate isomerase [Brocadia]KXK33657.1 MAG: N-(5'-phosphoribosyl)anthranilate isomerase [Candidatus Brocadia sinica]MBC6932293.1 phosphoribosylanthranilate isomerase [Candidatus Brocadia sp.]MBL1169789.1 phosphoribosylanthranilate isomerase [Candidatus Brocadia sp. AMX1]KAA0245088.1 MAG: phosphoribosylanthranilate isomerase [Candidatus Brocadia sp. AMX2]MCE7866619.1 phosphoribosylanthranilate isomerase [Candidatus Brocadia sp. AMX2]